MDKTLKNKVCDGQTVWHLFLSQDLWSRHYVAEQQVDTDSWKLFTSLMGANHISNNCPSQQEIDKFKGNMSSNFRTSFFYIYCEDHYRLLFTCLVTY